MNNQIVNSLNQSTLPASEGAVIIPFRIFPPAELSDYIFGILNEEEKIYRIKRIYSVNAWTKSASDNSVSEIFWNRLDAEEMSTPEVAAPISINPSYSNAVKASIGNPEITFSTVTAENELLMGGFSRESTEFRSCVIDYDCTRNFDPQDFILLHKYQALGLKVKNSLVGDFHFGYILLDILA
jgi:hypothetical protein